MKNLQVENIIFYHEPSIKPNVDIIVTKLCMWKQYNFETILTYNDVMNIQDTIGKGFGCI